MALTINYRSIGTNSGTLHSAGTCSITINTSIVTFSSATLPTKIGQGDLLTIDTTEYHILSRDSSSQVTVQETAAATQTDENYTIERKYNTLQAWETARGGNLVSDERREIGVAYNDGAFTARVTINGNTTDATYYMKLTAAEGQRHKGIAGSGVRIDAGGGFGNYPVRLQDPYCVLEWFEITNFLDNEAAIFTWGGTYIKVENCIFHNYDTLAACIEVYFGAIIRNCIFYDGAGQTAIFGNMSGRGQTLIVENCTIEQSGGTNGVKAWTGAFPVEVRNTISIGHTNTDFQFNYALFP